MFSNLSKIFGGLVVLGFLAGSGGEAAAAPKAANPGGGELQKLDRDIDQLIAMLKKKKKKHHHKKHKKHHRKASLNLSGSVTSSGGSGGGSGGSGGSSARSGGSRTRSGAISVSGASMNKHHHHKKGHHHRHPAFAKAKKFVKNHPKLRKKI